MTSEVRKRLLVTTSTLPCRDDDGEPRFVLDLSRALQRWYNVTILAPAHPDTPERHELSGVPIVRYRYAPLRRLETLAYPGAIGPHLKKRPMLWPLVPGMLAGLRRATARLLAEQKFDCVHCHWAIPQGFVHSGLVRRGASPPVVLTLHGGDVYTAKGAVKRAMIRRAFDTAAAVTVVSSALKSHLLASPLWSFTDDDLEVIPMGCDLDSFSPDNRDESVFADSGLPRPVILFVGRLAEKKGLPGLLKAMASPRLRATGASVAIAGDGPLREELERQTEALSLADRIRFLGSVPHTRLPQVYASADLFCAPFVIAADGDSEGLPTVLSEAGASGLASVVGDVGGVREIVADGESGIVVAPGDVESLIDALARVLEDEAERRRMAETALQRAPDYDWRRIAERYAGIIEGVL